MKINADKSILSEPVLFEFFYIISNQYVVLNLINLQTEK